MILRLERLVIVVRRRKNGLFISLAVGTYSSLAARSSGLWYALLVMMLRTLWTRVDCLLPEGNDMLDGRDGVYALRGGPGRDVLHARDRRADTLVGGSGPDSARLDGGLDRKAGIERILP